MSENWIDPVMTSYLTEVISNEYKMLEVKKVHLHSIESSVMPNSSQMVDDRLLEWFNLGNTVTISHSAWMRCGGVLVAASVIISAFIDWCKDVFLNTVGSMLCF